MILHPIRRAGCIWVERGNASSNAPYYRHIIVSTLRISNIAYVSGKRIGDLSFPVTGPTAPSRSSSS